MNIPNQDEQQKPSFQNGFQKLIYAQSSTLVQDILNREFNKCLQDKIQNISIFNYKESNISDDVFYECQEKADKLINNDFKEQIINYDSCRENCETTNAGGIVGFFVRERCYRNCRSEFNNLSKKVFHENKQNQINA